MTITTPPGWYPEPGQTPDGTGIERWWDGTEWTEFTRTAAHPAPNAPPQDLPEEGRGPRTGLIAAMIGGVLLMTGGVVGGIVVLGDDDHPRSAAPAASVSSRPGEHPLSSGKSDSGPQRRVLADPHHGLTLPIPRGWRQDAIQPPEGYAFMRTKAFACDYAQSGLCVHAGVYTVDLPPAADAKAAAERDIAVAAEKSYGTLRSHEQVKAGAVTVAGRAGYLVRWKVDPDKGDDGYVQSVAFPSADGSVLVGIRFSFDATKGAPGVRVMDEVVEGVRAVTGGRDRMS